MFLQKVNVTIINHLFGRSLGTSRKQHDNQIKTFSAVESLTK